VPWQKHCDLKVTLNLIKATSPEAQKITSICCLNHLKKILFNLPLRSGNFNKTAKELLWQRVSKSYIPIP